MTMTTNGDASVMFDFTRDPWLPTERNMRLLSSLAYAQDQDDCDLNRTLERALLLLRDEMLNGPATVVAETAKPKGRGGRRAAS